jgi:hypothetical protein
MKRMLATPRPWLHAKAAFSRTYGVPLSKWSVHEVVGSPNSGSSWLHRLKSGHERAAQHNPIQQRRT